MQTASTIDCPNSTTIKRSNPVPANLIATVYPPVSNICFPLSKIGSYGRNKTPGQGADQQCNFQEIQRKIGRTTAACRGNQSATRIESISAQQNQEQNKGCVTNTESYINNSKKTFSSNSNIARCAQRYCLSISSQS